MVGVGLDFLGVNNSPGSRNLLENAGCKIMQDLDVYNVSEKHKEGRWVWVTPRSQDKCDFQHQLFEPWRSLLEIRHFPVTSRSYCIAGATPKGGMKVATKMAGSQATTKWKCHNHKQKTTLSLHQLRPPVYLPPFLPKHCIEHHTIHPKNPKFPSSSRTNKRTRFRMPTGPRGFCERSKALGMRGPNGFGGDCLEGTVWDANDVTYRGFEGQGIAKMEGMIYVTWLYSILEA